MKLAIKSNCREEIVLYSHFFGGKFYFGKTIIILPGGKAGGGGGGGRRGRKLLSDSFHSHNDILRWLSGTNTRQRSPPVSFLFLYISVIHYFSERSTLLLKKCSNIQKFCFTRELPLPHKHIEKKKSKLIRLIPLLSCDLAKPTRPQLFAILVNKHTDWTIFFFSLMMQKIRTLHAHSFTCTVYLG